MIKKIILILIILLFISCSSNTIYKEPKNLIPKDTMVLLLADMIIATSAKNQKNKNLQRKINYMQLVYDKYKIDSVRFQKSNVYYTSNIEKYEEIFKEIKLNLITLQNKYEKEEKLQDSLKIKKKEISIDKKNITHLKNDFLIKK